MSVYDCLDGYEVRCFPVPFLHMGSNGLLRLMCDSGGYRFVEKGECVPYKTLFYNYGKNFIIFEYRLNSHNLETNMSEILYDISVVENGKCVGNITFDDLDKYSHIKKVYDYRGNRLNIKSIDDFKKLHEESKQYEYESQIPYSFNEKWYLPDRTTVEFYVGAILHNLLMYHCDIKHRRKIIKTFKKMNYVYMIESYVKWFKKLKLSRNLSVEDILDILDNPTKKNINDKLGFVIEELPCYNGMICVDISEHLDYVLDF